MRGWHRQNGANGGGKVHNDKRTHVREGATEPGRNGPRPVGPGRLAWPIPGSVRPPFLELEDVSTLNTWRHHHSQRERERERERAIRPRDCPQAREREKRREIIRKKDRSTRRKQPQVEEDVEALPRHPGGEGRHRRKRHHDQQCYA
jgi:hypothetical protein